MCLVIAPVLLPISGETAFVSRLVTDAQPLCATKSTHAYVFVSFSVAAGGGCTSLCGSLQPVPFALVSTAARSPRSVGPSWEIPVGGEG